MKNKKIIAAVLIAAVILISAAAYFIFGKPTAIGLIRKSAGNLGKVSSMKAEVSAEYEGSVSYSILNSVLSAPVAVEMDFDTESVMEPAVSHLDGVITGEILGISMDLPLESYVEEKDDKTISYVSVNRGNWIRHTQTPAQAEDAGESGDTAPQFDGKAFLGLIKKIIDGEIRAELSEETEMICGQEAYKIRVEVSGDLLQQLLEVISSGNGGAALPEDLDLTEADTDMDLYIYKKSKLPAKIRVGCAAIGNAVMQAFTNDDSFIGAATRFEITVLFTEYNTIDSLAVPEEVIMSAVDGDGQSLFHGIIPGF